MYNYKVYNRRTQGDEIEISGNVGGLTFLYHSLGGRLIAPLFVRPFVSKAYARYINSKRSVKKIKNFIEQYNIDLSEVRDPLDSFRTLNEFFIRRLKDESRPVDRDSSHLISPADARLQVFDLKAQNMLPVKGYWYDLAEFVQDKELTVGYSDGWCFVYRLAPCDYHRFCFIDKGIQEEVRRIKGILHSVNPIALASVNALMTKNYRELTVMHTENFGTVLHFEVGALMVGKVRLHNREQKQFSKGEEKGWFEFGGSTIVQFFRKDAVIPDADILMKSASRMETLVRMGERTGVKK